jgi:hypothetical protein
MYCYLSEKCRKEIKLKNTTTKVSNSHLVWQSIAKMKKSHRKELVESLLVNMACDSRINLKKTF